jgi:hypothetical protein
MDPNNPRILYAAFWDHLRLPWEVRSGGPGSGIWKSTDGGDTWRQLTKGFPELVGKTSVTVAANSDRVYAMIEADPKGGLYRSEDGGENWRLVSDSWDIRHRAWYYTEVYADPQNPDVVWVLAAPVMKSIDGGRTFTRVRTPHGDNHDLWINPTNSDFLVNANDGGGNVSLNGGRTWSTQQNQPTAQFYRVNTDNRFPYYVYGGQQDNSSVAIVSQAPGGIGWKDWHAVAGCETAYVVFDPDNPVKNYGGCYMGQIMEWDERTGAQRNVMAYPQLPAAMASRDMKYRFNWNAPIVVSQHDPSVMYHAGNVLLKSMNSGNSWVEVSPDLTRDEDDKQGPGGGPFFNDTATTEIYTTIMYVAESPHDATTLWVGTDDGLVHVTQDGGATWNDVTPSDISDGLVNAIDVSSHDPATAYVAYTRYKFNDFTPHIYKTNDFGRRWEHVTEGIAEEAFVRVVREDPVRRGLLYAGTEAGLYVSWDDGEHWQSLQLNMPLTPINDLQVHKRDNDLVAATSGRSFWILDDLSPLQQASQSVAGAGLHLFNPHPAHRVAGFGGFGGFGGVAGTNPPFGAIIDMHVSQVSDSTPVTLEVVDGQGAVIRSYSSSKAADSVDVLQLKPGHNRVAWNLRHETVENVPGMYVWGSLTGRRVVPGTYEVRLTQGDVTRTASVEVLADPRASATLADFREQDELMVAIDEHLQALHQDVVRLRDVRGQIEDVMGRTTADEGGEAIAGAGETLVEQLTAVEDSLVQKRVVDGQTVINFPARLNFHYIYLRGSVDAAEGGVTDGMGDLFTDLSEKWTRHRSELDVLLGPKLDEFNSIVSDHGVPAVIVQRAERVISMR